MLSGLKMSFLTRKYVLYRPEINGKGGYWILKVLKGNIPKDRAQRPDGKNGAIFLVIMFIPTVMIFKMSEYHQVFAYNGRLIGFGLNCVNI